MDMLFYSMVFLKAMPCCKFWIYRTAVNTKFYNITHDSFTDWLITFIWHKESVAPILALIVRITLNSDVTTRLAGNIDIVSLTKVLSHVGHGSAVFIMHVQKFGRAVVPIRFLARVGHVNRDVNSLSETKSYGPYASIGIPIRILRESGTFYDSESGWKFLCYPRACSVYLRI